jgi:hypothetical protein
MNTMIPGGGSADFVAAASERLTFRVPPAFFELPVYEAPEQVGQALIELAQDIYPAGNAELWYQYAAAQLPVVAEMMEDGVSYAGFCLLDLDGRRSTATVTAKLLESVPGGQKMTASSVAAELAGAGDQTQIETVWLAAGEAVARFSSEIMSLPAEITDSGRVEEVQIGKIAVFLPLRRDAEMALFELSTPCMEDWDLYSELFFNIVNTLEVHDGESESPLGESPVYDPLPQQPETLPPSGPTDVASGVEVPLQAKSVRDVFG